MIYNRKLVLADGTVFPGNSFGSPNEVIAEVMFNTGMTGYQEILTDPSYYNQMVCMTYPMIGNYGINKNDFENATWGATALIVKEYAEVPSNWQMEMTLDEFLKSRNTPGLTDVDTRALTRKIREDGATMGIIVSAETSTEEALQRLHAAPVVNDHVRQVSPKEAKVYEVENPKFKVAMFAFGAKNGIINELNKRDVEVHVLPYSTTVEEVKAINPDGVLLSNGPGDPKDIPEVLPVVRELQATYPLMGVCLGNQLFALANGADTVKMKFGHHGTNTPVKDLETDRTHITSQNHGYMVDRASLEGTDLEVTHVAINDDTVEGLKHKKYPAFTVQYHPEANPGPADSKYLFDRFIANMQEVKKHA